MYSIPALALFPLLDNWGGGKQTKRMRELLERLFQVDFLKGLAVTFRTQNPKNIVTEQYPLERPMVGSVFAARRG